MFGRGPNYLEDKLLAEKIEKEEQEALEHTKVIMMLQEHASEFFVKWLIATESGATLNELNTLKVAYEAANAQLEKEQKKRLTTTAKLTSELKTEEKPIRTFNEDEMKLINDHYKKLPDSLRKLMDITINDEIISYEFIPNPVFICGEGRIYDNNKLNELFEEKDEVLAPYNRIKFKKSDVIPCNTLIKSMDHLLDIINGKLVQPESFEFKLASLNKIESRQRISADLIAIIERYYMQMEDKHKALFDIICRDPVTKVIMDDPVFLPDGYVYDRSTALAYLGLKEGTCPLNPAKIFKKEDITPCYFVIAVLEQLKQNMNDHIKQNVEQTVNKTWSKK